MPTDNALHEYAIAPDLKGSGVVLIKDGVECFCHKLMPFVTGGAIAGSTSLMRMSCNTGCPHANVYERTISEREAHLNIKSGLVYKVTCDGANVEFDVKELEKATPEKEGKIIQLGK